jgi:hypothetical protein
MAPRRIIAGALLAAAMLALAACDTGPAVQPTPTTAPAEPTPTTATAPKTTIVFETSGGIAGMMKRMEINPDRQATVTDQRMGKPGAASPVEVQRYDELLSLIDKSDFFNLQDEYNKGAVADDIQYVVTVTQGDRTKSVKVYEVGGRDVTPQPLLDLIDRLKVVQDIVEKSA